MPKEKQITGLTNKIRNLYKDPKFKALSPEHQDRIKEKVYDRYVVPVLSNHGMTAPPKSDWLGKTNFQVSDEEKKQRIENFGMAGAEELAKVSVFGSKVLRTTALFEDKSHLPYLKVFSPLLKKEADLLEKGGNEVIKRVEDWRTDNYSQVLQHQVASGAGEFAGQLPVYMALGGLWSGLGISGQTLARTPIGKWTAEKLVSAADGYLSTKALGGNNKEATTNAATFAGMSAAGSGAKYLGKGVKAYLGKLLSLGGRKLVQESFAHAAANATEKVTIKNKDYIVAKLDEANKKVLDELSQRHFGAEYSKLGVSAKEFITKQLGTLTDQAEKEVAIHGHDVIEARVSQALEKQTERNPVLKQNIAAMEAITKIPTSKVVARRVADVAKVNTGMVSMERTVSKLADETPTIKPGAALASSLEFATNAANVAIKSLGLKVEGNTNKLLIGWPITTGPEKKAILTHLQDIFPGESIEKLNERASTLFNHLVQLKNSGHLLDSVGVFKSTKTAGTPTIWQQELAEEVKNLGLKLENNETPKEVIHSINNTLIQAGAYPQTEVKESFDKVSARINLTDYNHWLQLADKPGVISAKLNQLFDTGLGGNTWTTEFKHAKTLYFSNPLFRDFVVGASKWKGSTSYIQELTGAYVWGGKRELEKKFTELANGFNNHYPYGMTKSTPFETKVLSLTNLADSATALIKAYETSPEYSYDLFRGIYEYDKTDKLWTLKPGDEYTLNRLQGFGTSLQQAKGWGNVILKIEGTKKALPIEWVSYMSEDEHLTNGHFKVVDVTDEKDHRIITVKQLKPLLAGAGSALMGIISLDALLEGNMNSKRKAKD